MLGTEDFAFLTSSQMILMLLVQEPHSCAVSGKNVGNFVYHGTGISEGTVEMFLKEESYRRTNP